MAKRNPNSVNQAFMTAFFGKDADKYPADHNKWPEPQRSIYLRMLGKKYTIVTWDFIKSMKKLTAEFNKLNEMLNV